MVTVAVLGLGLSACDSAQQEATETAPAADSPEMQVAPPNPPEATTEETAETAPAADSLEMQTKKAVDGGMEMMMQKKKHRSRLPRIIRICRSC